MTRSPGGAPVGPTEAPVTEHAAGAGGAPLRWDRDRCARAGLGTLVEPGDERLGATLKDSPPSELLERIRSPRRGDALPTAWRSRLGALDVDSDRVAAACVGARFLVPGDEEWPSAVEDLDERAPIGLWVVGGLHLADTVRRSVAVVGARAATTYGERLAAELAADLGERGWCVVSGAAYGIDGAAHRGALAVGAPTVAVLACGVDTAYPRGHDDLLRQVRSRGLVVSELPPGSSPTRGRFLERNRLIAALAVGTVVVEAAVRSGARRTVADAASLGRAVMAVPGPVTSPASAGCHELVRCGEASLVSDAGDVLDIVGALGVDDCPHRRAPSGVLDGLEPLTLRVLEALPRRGLLPMGRVAVLGGLDLPTVRRQLALLASQGLVVADPQGWRRTSLAREALGATSAPGTG